MLMKREKSRGLESGYAYLNKKSSEDGLTTRAIHKIIARVGEMVDIKGLSPHDLRHTAQIEARSHSAE